MISLLAEKMITEIPNLVTEMKRREKEVRKSFVRRDYFIIARLALLGDHWKSTNDRSSLTRQGKICYRVSKVILNFTGFSSLYLVIGIIAP